MSKYMYKNYKGHGIFNNSVSSLTKLKESIIGVLPHFIAENKAFIDNSKQSYL